MIAIGSDHGGFRRKEKMKEYLEKNEISYQDYGCFSEERANYPDFARAVCKHVLKDEENKGILVCTSGIGMSIVANKFKGIRAALCVNQKAAQFSRLHNDSNILCIGADYISEEETLEILKIWLATEFEGGRHEQRVNLIKEIEQENMK